METTESAVISTNQIKSQGPISAAELQKSVAPEIVYIIVSLITPGLTAVSAPPKFAKGWFAVQMCIAVARGADFLGFPVQKAECIYYSLHDPAPRVMSRLDRLLDGADAPPGLYIGTDLRTVDDGLVNDLNQLINLHPHIKMVLIDSLADIRGDSKTSDAQILRVLKKFADAHEIAIVLIDQLSKPGELYYADNIKAADTMIKLSNGTTANEKVLSAVGRDIKTIDLRLEFNKMSCQWVYLEALDPAAELAAHPVVRVIQALLKQTPDGWTGTSSQFLSVAETMKFKLSLSPEKISRVFTELDPFLPKLNICHRRLSHGTGGAPHSFTYLQLE